MGESGWEEEEREIKPLFMACSQPGIQFSHRQLVLRKKKSVSESECKEH